MKLKLKDHKPLLAIFRKSDDELHVILDTTIDTDDDTIIEFDNSQYYIKYGDDFSIIMKGRKAAKPHKTSDWKKEWDI